MKKLSWRTLSICVLAACLALGGFTSASAGSDFPKKKIKLIIPFDPGTSSDRAGRMLASQAEKIFGGKITIVNKPGSAGAIGYTVLHSSRPDGYTLCFATSTLVTHKILKNIDFDYNDVKTVLLFQFDPVVLSVGSKSAFASVDELIADAKAQPGNISQATGAPGGLLNVASKAFEDATGIDLKLIPSGGGGAKPAIQLGGGHVDTAVASVGETAAQVDAGNIKVLGVMAESRVNRWPDTPTLKEQGFDLSVGAYRGVIAPLGTPDDRIKVLTDIFKQAAETEEFKKFLNSAGAIYTFADGKKSTELFDQQSAIFSKLLK